jgi:hypothetical protein
MNEGMNERIWVVCAQSGIDGRLCYLGSGETKREAIDDATGGGKLRSGQWVEHMLKLEARDHWPQYEGFFQ